MGRATDAVEVRFDVPASMRDGVVLAADVYAPAEDGMFPVLLMRTPYGKHTAPENAWSGVDPVATARAGFVVVIQDVRGRFASEGDWNPLQHEASDGADSVAWAARLPRSNGRVGLFGGSYSGNTQWQAALERPAELAAMSALMTWADPEDGVYSRGGVLELGLDLSWSLLTGVDDVIRRHRTDPSLPDRVEAIIDEFDHLRDRGFWRTAVSQVEMLAGHTIRDIGSLARVTGETTAADPADLSARQERAGVPVLHTAGWYDIFLQGTLDNHRATAAAGVECSLVIGPWSHDNFGHVVGEVDFGIEAARDFAEIGPTVGTWPEAQVAWLRRHLDEGPAGGEDFPPVRVFVMGRNTWVSMPEWPPPRATDTAYLLRGDGTLAAEATPSSDVPSAPIAYSYDLADPVPTTGGSIFITPAFPAGPVDQRSVEARPDVVTFTSDELSEDLEIAGRVLAHLTVSSSAPSADWVVRLCDVHPDGTSINVCDGILRTPDARTPRRHTVDLWSTHMVFLRGHRVRVQVANSSFPRWERTPPEAAGHVRQEARVHTDPDHPSVIVLPVVESTQTRQL
jgi:uncharacterized protein